eukprot:s4007_g3.t1
MLLESGDLVSTMLYVMEAHQHASLVGFSVQCGAFTLMPLKSSQCPSMAETEELPACRASLGLNAVCEADVEVGDESCSVAKELDNCRDFDVYKMQELDCGVIGCRALSHVQWISALVSFAATAGWNAFFYARCLIRTSLRQEVGWGPRVLPIAICTFLALWLVTTTFIGFASGSGAVLAMVFLCPLLPVCAWALAFGIAVLPEGTWSQVIVMRSAAMEIPFFNVLVCVVWNFDVSSNACLSLGLDRHAMLLPSTFQKGGGI